MPSEPDSNPTARQLREQVLPPIFQSLLPKLSKEDLDKLPRVYPKLPESITTRIKALPAHDPSGPHLARLILDLKRNDYAWSRLHRVTALYTPGGPRSEVIDALCTTLENTSYDYGHGIDLNDLSISPAIQQKVLLIAQALQLIDEATPDHNPLVVTVHYDENLHLSNSVLGHTYEHMIRFPGQANLIAQGWVIAHTG